MNTKKIKVEFKEEYEKFFKNNSLVLSLPFIFNWVSDVNENYNGVEIKSKVPLRAYVGINELKNKRIILNTINYYSVCENEFKNYEIKEYILFFKKVEDYLNDDFLGKEISYGLEFNIFLEGKKGLGLSIYSIITALIFIGYIKKVYKEDLNLDLLDKNILEVIKGENFYSILIDKIFSLNKKKGTYFSVGDIISSLFISNYPIVSFEKKGEVFGYKLNDLENIVRYNNTPSVDFGLIYSGFPVLTDNIVNNYFSNNNEREELSSNLQKWFGNDDIKENFNENTLNLIKNISLKVLNRVVKIYSVGYDEDNVNNMIDAINDISRFNLMTKNYSKRMFSIYKKLINNFLYNKFLGLGVNDTMVMGGCFNFVIPYEGYRKNLIDSINETRKSVPNVKLLYSSWQDGIETKGLIVEQDIDNSIFSEYIKKTDLLIIGDDGTRKIVGEEFLLKEKDALFLYVNKKKIYFNGRKLCSKELKSQNATIYILTKLLEKKGDYVYSKDLTLSSYSTNKNDMLGKIISPLEKLIKTEKDLEFKISCSGTPNDFKINLEKNQLRIYIVKSLD